MVLTRILTTVTHRTTWMAEDVIPPLPCPPPRPLRQSAKCYRHIVTWLVIKLGLYREQTVSGSGVYSHSLTVLSSPADANKPGSLGDHVTQLTSAGCAFCLVTARLNLDDCRLPLASWCPVSCTWPLSKSLIALSPQPRDKQNTFGHLPAQAAFVRLLVDVQVKHVNYHTTKVIYVCAACGTSWPKASQAACSNAAM